MRGWIKKGIDAYLDYKSFKTKRHLVIIESDDWGSLRTKNKASRDKLNAIQPRIKNDVYTQFDSIATHQDLEALFEVLLSVKDRNGNPACVTVNVCTANPDFDKIKASAYEQFFYKPFSETLDEYSTNTSLFKTWQKGIDEGFFKPQLHGREHVHGLAWLKELKTGNRNLLKAFEQETWGIPYIANTTKRRRNLQASLDHYGIENEEEFQNQWVLDSCDIFKKAFGYAPKSFIPPAYTWHTGIHKSLKSSGIQTIQGMKLQYKPNHQKQTHYKKIPHYTGQMDRHSGIIYTIRNAYLEPASQPDINWVDLTLKGIENAFKNKQPAIIGSHRINFIGRLDVQHRDKNLKMLKRILKQIVNKYPDVEFIDSGQLADILNDKSNKLN